MDMELIEFLVSGDGSVGRWLRLVLCVEGVIISFGIWGSVFLCVLDEFIDGTWASGFRVLDLTDVFPGRGPKSLVGFEGADGGLNVMSYGLEDCRYHFDIDTTWGGK